MQEMCNRANAALAEGCDEEAIRLCKVQANFLEQHLNSWVALMTADMRRFAKGDLYRGLSYLTEGFLESEGAFLAELLSENEEPSRTVASDRSE